jgi:hypothetical protein
MNAYRNAEIEYRERCKARIQRQLEISEDSFNIVSCQISLSLLSMLYICLC